MASEEGSAGDPGVIHGPSNEGLVEAAAMEVDESETDAASDPPTKAHPKDEKRVQICLFLSKRVTKRGRLETGALDDAMEEFDIKFGGVRSIWRMYKNAIIEPDKYELDVSRKKGSGRKSKFTAAYVQAAVNAVPCKYRLSLRTLAAKTGITKTTLHRHFRNGDLAQSTANKPPPEEERQKQDVQKNTMQLKLQKDLKEYYERENTRAVEKAKKEARAQHSLQLEKIRGELQQQFQRDKGRVWYQLRVEIHRHQLEVTRLKEALERLAKE